MKQLPPTLDDTEKSEFGPVMASYTDFRRLTAKVQDYAHVNSNTTPVVSRMIVISFRLIGVFLSDIS